MGCDKYDTCKNHHRCVECHAMSDIYNHYPCYEKSKTYKLNLNDPIKVKLTDLGKDIYYHRFDDLHRYYPNLSRLTKPTYPKVDENGFTEFQLWSFMQLYGPHLGLAMPNVIDDVNLYLSDADLEEVKDGQPSGSDTP